MEDSKPLLKEKKDKEHKEHHHKDKDKEKKKKHAHGGHGGHGGHGSHGKSSSASCWICDFKLVSFVIIGVLTLIYVVVELGVAVWLQSLALLSDGFHNLSDVIALYIAFWAVQATKRDITDNMSYGWARSELIGGLTNGCFLLSLSLYVFLEAIPRFIQPDSSLSDNGWWFISVAAAGVIVNTIGTVIFAITGMSHGHSHSHGGHGGHGGHGKKKNNKEFEIENDDEALEIGNIQKKKRKHHKKKEKSRWQSFDVNVWAVFIHYAGDMLSSFLILVSGLLLYFFDEKWTFYIDPAASVVIVILILWTTVPLVKNCAIILLQSTPSDVDMDTLRNELTEISGIQSVHDLHVWNLVDGMIISSVHLKVEEGVDWPAVAEDVKEIFHEHGIHSITIQPEFVPKDHRGKVFCEENCVKDCEENWCCKKTADKAAKHS